MKKIYILLIALVASTAVFATAYTALLGKFTVNDKGDQVRFSPLLLGSNRETKEFGFGGAVNGSQWSYWKIKDTYFAWGTGDDPNYTGIKSSFKDWGDNPIINAENEPYQWRTLSADEWQYILSGREHAEYLCGMAQITFPEDYVYKGLIIFPDDAYAYIDGSYLKFSDDLKFAPYASTSSSFSYTKNGEYTYEQWIQMEAAGAVFLQTMYYCMDNKLGIDGNIPNETQQKALMNVWYWTKTPSGDDRAKALMISNNGPKANQILVDIHKNYQLAVRLVKDVKETDAVIHTVTFLDWDGTELLKEKVEEGKDAKGPGKNPTREGYIFTGWDKPLTNITSDLTVTAQFTLDKASVKELSGRFSVNKDGKVIVFSQGNLQYWASKQIWRFALNQYNIIGEKNKNIAANYNGWIDLFGWGTGNNPTYASTSNAAYATFTDWGTNIIENGGGYKWRTLTMDEWDYIINQRPTDKRGPAVVAGTNGFVLLPDEWSAPSGISFDPAAAKPEDNTFSAEEWQKLEDNGAVFLPCAGIRSDKESNTTVSHPNKVGIYWSNTPETEDPSKENYAQSVYIMGQYIMENINPYSNGLSVRLVRDNYVLHTVTFLDWDGTELLKEKVEDGKDAKGPEKNPTRDGYKFTGWSKPITNITADLTVIAQYKEIDDALEEAEGDGSRKLKVESQKLWRDGQLLIIRNGRTYNAQGQLIIEN